MTMNTTCAATTGDDAKRFSLASGVLYGPVRSRRLGLSLGVNILPYDRKICSFNCGYCQCGWTTIKVYDAFPYPSPDEIERTLAGHLREASAAGTRYDSLTLAGNGEPTLHPAFAAVVERVIRARDAAMASAKTSILSNASTVGDPAVRRGLDLLDERIMKLDAGSPAKLREVNLPLEPFDIDKTITGLTLLRDVVLQSMFVDGRVSNCGDADVIAWIACIARVRPKYVQIYSIDRVPADGKLEVVGGDRLRAIADRLKRATGIEGEVYSSIQGS